VLCCAETEQLLRGVGARLSEGIQRLRRSLLRRALGSGVAREGGGGGVGGEGGEEAVQSCGVERSERREERRGLRLADLSLAAAPATLPASSSKGAVTAGQPVHTGSLASPPPPEAVAREAPCRRLASAAAKMGCDATAAALRIREARGTAASPSAAARCASEAAAESRASKRSPSGRGP